jgi:hypothetical protein
MGRRIAVQHTLQLTSTFRMRLRRNGCTVLAAELRRYAATKLLANS